MEGPKKIIFRFGGRSQKSPPWATEKERKSVSKSSRTHGIVTKGPTFTPVHKSPTKNIE